MTISQPIVISDGPALPAPAERVCDVVMNQARLHPDRPAVVCGSRSVTYGELAETASAVADAIEADEYCAGSRRIGVLATRTAATVAHLLGVSLSGRSFVLVNPEASESSVQHIHASAGLSVTVDPESGIRHRHASIAPSAPSAPVRPTLDDEAYVLYTSGSTGKPKGVSVSQRNLASSNGARLAVYEPFGTPVFLLLSPFHFDSSMAGLWGTLAAGGTLVVPVEDERRDPAALSGLIAGHGVTHLLTVPSFYAELLRSWGQDEHSVSALASLRMMICAGEALAQSVIDQHFTVLAQVALGNEYGPTECTVWSTYRIYEQPARSTIGFPIPGASLHLLDDQLRPVESGSVGQIAVSGPGVAGGYVGDPQRTHTKFVTLQDGSRGPVRAYLTGDLGRWSDEDGLEFVGRLDNEVKIRGVRITIEAIEEALAMHPAVQGVAVAYDAETSTSYAFVVTRAGSPADAESLRRTGEEALGVAAIPDRVLFVDTLPRTAHDKIDRAALLASAVQHTSVEPAAGSGELADRIAHAWSEILGVSVAGTADGNFFTLGGNSLTVLRLSRALGKIAGRTIGVKDVYHCSTIAQQVELLSRT